MPIDFVPRALAPALGTRLELRRPSRLIVVGDLRVPRITARIEPLGAIARVTFDVAPATPHTVAQEGARVLVRFDADALDATLPASPVARRRPGGARRRTAARHRDRARSALRVVQASDAAGERGAGRIVVDVVAQTTEAPPAPPAARRAGRTRDAAAARPRAAGRGSAPS